MFKHLRSLPIVILSIVILSLIVGGCGGQSEHTLNQGLKMPCHSSSTGCPDVVWVKIKGGSFMMGSQRDSTGRKRGHRVSVSDFRIAKTEVTVRQYRTCVKAGVCTKPKTGDKCHWGKPGHKDHPINCIDWGQARTFSRWVGGDLPTEAQWEYAARGGQSFKYAGSNNANDVGWHSTNSGRAAHPVKQKQHNDYGLYDMSGNVWEWTLDKYHETYRGAPSDGDQAWGEVPACKIKCSVDSSKRALRGGSWRFGPNKLRVTSRLSAESESRVITFGFRSIGPAL